MQTVFQNPQRQTVMRNIRLTKDQAEIIDAVVEELRTEDEKMSFSQFIRDAVAAKLRQPECAKIVKKLKLDF